MTGDESEGAEILRDEAGRLAPGTSRIPGSGRKKGTGNRIQTEVMDWIHEATEAIGAHMVEKARARGDLPAWLIERLRRMEPGAACLTLKGMDDWKTHAALLLRCIPRPVAERADELTLGDLLTMSWDDDETEAGPAEAQEHVA